MKKLLLLVAVSGSVLFFAQCSSKKTTGGASTTAVDNRVAEVKRNFTPAQMEEGHVIWTNNCGKCHKLIPGNERTVDKWEAILPGMTKKARLDDVQAGKVRAYLLVNAKM